MTETTKISVTSHVARDFLQSAALFSTLPKIVWEYVSNSLDAAADGVPPVVVVDISSNCVSIADNGRGMSQDELAAFFRMHGENVLRKRGKRVRGRFGTGKSAAFGLANCLRVDTRQKGLRNVVSLRREDIEAANSGDPFPVRHEVDDQPTDAPDGTIVEITEFNNRRNDVDKVLSYLERHLSRYKQRARVFVNGHECKHEELPYVDEVRRRPDASVAKHIGDVCLVLRVSPVPLDDEMAGVDIFSHGIWHATTLAGLERKEKANYIFGEVDVPILEDGEWPIPAFDNTRSNTLNVQNPVVAVLLGWIAEEIEAVRSDLIRRDKERRQTEAAKALMREARRIAEILNADFAEQELELELTRKVASRGGTQRAAELQDDDGELFPGGGTEPTGLRQLGSPHGAGRRGVEGGPGEFARPGPSLGVGSEPGTRKTVAPKGDKRRKGQFTIDYENATSASPRSRYDAVSKTIYVNLDHAQIASALRAGGGTTTSRQFREMCYEVAAVEYALALPYEKIERDELYASSASEVLFDVRSTINRVTARFMSVLEPDVAEEAV